jgi:DnaK suppressor protein
MSTSLVKYVINSASIEDRMSLFALNNKVEVKFWFNELLGGQSMKQDKVFFEDYRPVKGELFMNDRQLEFFRRKLVNWKNDLMSDSKETIEGLQDNTRNIPDIADRASEETDRALELRTRDRQRKLVSKIDAALRRIDEGEYGYCEMTGEPISLKRLDARPIATMTLEAQESHERREKVHRDD